MSNPTAVAARALSMIAKYGADVTHWSVVPRTSNPVTGVATASRTGRTIKAVIDPCKRELRQGVGVEAGDIRLTIAPGAFTVLPTLTDEFTLRSDDYSVAAINTTEVSGGIVLYEIQARRA